MIKNYREIIDKYKGRKELIIQKIKERQIKKDNLNNKLVVILKSQKIIQKIVVDLQNSIKYNINKVINSILETCFPNEYEFQFNFIINKDKTEAEINFIKNGCKENVNDEAGGGLRNILAVAFRIVLLSLSQNRKVLLLDEPFADLSEELHEIMMKILKKLSDELNIQIIMSTHNHNIIYLADKVFKINKKDENSFVE